MGMCVWNANKERERNGEINSRSLPLFHLKSSTQKLKNQPRSIILSLSLFAIKSNHCGIFNPPFSFNSPFQFLLLLLLRIAPALYNILGIQVVYEMSWNNTHSEVHHANTTYPYNTAGSFLEYFEGLTYEHVNFIFSGASHSQDTVYPPLNSNFYKFGFSDFGSPTYYNQPQAYRIHDHEPIIYEHRRLENSATQPNVQSTVNAELEEFANATAFDNLVECPRRHHNSHDFQVVWQDNVDPDNMTYEELLELGETVGTQSRGLSQELIALLPVSKYKYSFFSLKRSRRERCVICQMEYKRGNRRITLPCKHIYHVGCGTKWLSINKACPICYTEVFGDTSKHCLQC